MAEFLTRPEVGFAKSGYIGLQEMKLASAHAARKRFNLLPSLCSLQTQTKSSSMTISPPATPWLQPGCKAQVKIWRSRNGIWNLRISKPAFAAKESFRFARQFF